MIWANQVAKIAFVSGHLIVPSDFVCFYGSLAGRWRLIRLMGNSIAFGVIGYVESSGCDRPVSWV